MEWDYDLTLAIEGIWERKEGFREQFQRYLDRGIPIANAISKVMDWLSDS